MSAPLGPVTRDVLLDQLRWRYATKKFDPARRIPAADWAALEEALVLSPSSFGLQPWKFLVVTDPAVRERLVEVSWNQRQVADASHLVVFTVRRSLDAADLDRHLGRVAEVRGVPPAALEGYRAMMHNSLVAAQPGFDVRGWAGRQVYIALGSFLTAAALLGIDACPMEGIVPERYDEILGLVGGPYATLVVAPAGYRAVDDAYASLPKVRFVAGEVVGHVK